MTTMRPLRLFMAAAMAGSAVGLAPHYGLARHRIRRPRLVVTRAAEAEDAAAADAAAEKAALEVEILQLQAAKLRAEAEAAEAELKVAKEAEAEEAEAAGAAATAAGATAAAGVAGSTDSSSTPSATPGGVPGRAAWTLRLDVGRERGTWMPAEWGASGGRLAMKVDVDFTTLPLRSFPSENLVGDEKRTQRVLPLVAKARYMSDSGEREVDIKEGGWTISVRESVGQPDVLRFWLEFGEDCVKKDVNIPKVTRALSLPLPTRSSAEQHRAQTHSVARQRTWHVEIVKS